MRLRFLVNRAAAAALICLSAGAVHAQGLPSIRIGQTVQSTLGERDPSFVEHGRFKAYRFDAAAGETYLITLRSRSFNPYLSVAWLVGGLSEVLVANDDGVAGTDSRIRWKAPADGSYVVVAQSFTREGEGAFTLNLDRAPQPTTAAPRQIQPGDTISGELAETDAVEEDDSFFDTYLLQATRGQRLRMEMRSNAFDTFLAFGRQDSGGWQALDTDDDGLGEGTDSRLLVTIPEDGVYAIRANSVGQAAVGPYQLRVLERAAAASPAAQSITLGSEVLASLDEGDAEADDGSLFDLYTFSGRAGQRVQIRLASDRFDTLLSLGRMLDGAFREIASNDDAGEGTDSALDLTLPTDGEYAVRAQALSTGGNGPYRLRLDAGR